MNAYKKFLETHPLRHFGKKEVILRQSEVPPLAYIIKKGVVKTYNITSAGEEKPINVHMRGDLFPVAWIFGKARYSQYFYEALTDCSLYAVPAEEYLSYLQQDAAALFEIFDLFVDNYLNFQMHVNSLEQSKASDKVLNIIHFLSLRFGKDVRTDRVRIQLPLTQQDLANFIGLTRETTSIELKKLESAGIISYSNQSYLVRTDRLDAILDDEYDLGVGTGSSSDLA